LRRAAVSTASNIVEGSARRTTREYVNFLSIATASGAEAQYLIDLSSRLDFVARPTRDAVYDRYGELLRSLQKLVNSLSV